MNYERIFFTGICGALCFMGLSTIISGEGLHTYAIAIIGLITGLILGYINQVKDKS